MNQLITSAAKYPDVGLIIQGPILSRGRKPAETRKPHSEVKPQDIISYDCTENINALVKSARPIFGGVLCTTWDTENIIGLEASIASDHLLRLKDVTREIRGNSSLLPFNNKLRQFYSTSKGIKELVRRVPGIEFVIKIRTDQFLNLELLAFEFDKLKDRLSKSNCVVTPGFVEGMVSGLHDFFVAGKASTLMVLFEEFSTREFEYCFSPHTDLFNFLAKKWVISEVAIGEIELFLKDGLYCPVSTNQAYLAYTMWTQHIESFSLEVWNSVFWRGESIRNIFLVEPKPFDFIRDFEAQINRLPNSQKWLDSTALVSATNWSNYFDYKGIRGTIFKRLALSTISCVLNLTSVLGRLAVAFRMKVKRVN